ncbi:MAG: T3SS effector HopA1 family protein [Jatrophihabitans sp.]|uniref:T3SS effector HopA1 family protein n=1 Tax=Jatrophihabitans sp. TaxID=1932789 RepID=UPI003F81E3D4
MDKSSKGFVLVGGPHEQLGSGRGSGDTASTQVAQGPVVAAGDAAAPVDSHGGRATGPWATLSVGAPSNHPTPWPAWAAGQVHHAVALLAEAGHDAHGRRHTAAVLYDEWFAPIITDDLPLVRPLTGVYRLAHAGAASRRTAPDGVTVRRHDAIASDGWWRTWGERWCPPRHRRDWLRLLLSPHPHAAPAVVHEVTATLLDAEHPWVLGAATDARRLRRSGSIVLDLPHAGALPADLLVRLEPLLLPVTPPLSRPLALGVGLAETPDNGMTFGEHRCHLLALALREPGPVLHELARLFVQQGLDPARPWRRERASTGAVGRDGAG